MRKCNSRTMIWVFVGVLASCTLLTGPAMADTMTVRFIAFGQHARAMESHLATLDEIEQLSVVTNQLNKKARKQIARCVEKTELDDRCVRHIGSGGATYALILSVKPSSGSVKVVLQVYDVISGEMTGMEVAPCDGCDKRALQAAAEALVRDKLNLSDKNNPVEDAWIEVDAPEGAEVSVTGKGNVEDLDGNRYQVEPGTYQVVVTKPEHAPYETEVSVAAGTTEAVEATLSPVTDTTSSVDRKPGKGRWIGAIVGGGLLAGAGIYLIAIDGPRQDNGVRLRTKNRTLGYGIGGLVVGSLVAGVGIYKALASSEQPRERTVTFHIYQGGAGVGWAGRF